ERRGDFLGPLAREQEPGYLALAWGEASGALLDGRSLGLGVAPPLAQREGIADACEERRRGRGLLEEGDRSRLERTPGRRHGAGGGEHDDGKRRRPATELVE